MLPFVPLGYRTWICFRAQQVAFLFDFILDFIYFLLCDTTLSTQLKSTRASLFSITPNRLNTVLMFATTMQSLDIMAPQKAISANHLALSREMAANILLSNALLA